MFANDMVRDHLKTIALCLQRLLPSPFARRYLLTFVDVNAILPHVTIASSENIEDVFIFPPPGWQLTRICRCHWRQPISVHPWLIESTEIDRYILNLQRVST